MSAILPLVYQTALADIKVTVRVAASDYEIEVQKAGQVVDTKAHDSMFTASVMADILLQVYAARLEDELLHH